MSVKVTKDGMAAFKRGLEELVRKRVLVGVPADTTERQPDPDAPEPITNAALAYIHDNGSPAANIPARPFMRPGIEDAKEEIAGRMKATAKAVLAGAPDAADRGLHAVGMAAANSIKAKITDGAFAPLAPATIAKRRARGRTSEKPLTDTGQMRNAITYVVAPKE
ncbi:hypothetical protein [Phenylobacterium sp.]|uniref:hypothetical protein n=1 Tax=Phenylobacterium sp. TaxID=1871053 RepID=UPI0035B1921D